MIRVYCVFRCIDGELIEEPPPPASSQFRASNCIGLLTNLSSAVGELGPTWVIEIILRGLREPQRIIMALEPFLTSAEHLASHSAPICFAHLGSVKNAQTDLDPTGYGLRWLWLFRDDIYVSERNPRPSETDAVTLQIKSLRFQRDDAMSRLREQVANFEAIEESVQGRPRRQSLSDDVKLLVWARDGGACVRCGSRTALHFDHVIPFARGGSDESENIQILCRACNLAKSDRIV